jgi:glycosyltransferase involved in cell wall biosynthesis
MNIISPINQLGYGIAGLNIAKALSKKCDVALWAQGDRAEVGRQEDVNIIRTLIGKRLLADFNQTCLKIWHQHDMSMFVGKGMHIGFPFFELDRFTDVEKHSLNSLDKLFVTSKWAKDISMDNLSLSNENVHVVPLGVDSEIFLQNNDSINTNETIFFNCGKWEIRKGHDVLVDMFNMAFEPEDNVQLWMMTSNPFLNAEQDTEWKKLYKDSKMGDKIHFIDRVKTQSEVYNIMSKTDCGVFPSRAEGWNLELLEMMACGKQVIATDYSAHTEFCNSDNALLIDIHDTEAAFDGIWFNGNGQWAKIDEDSKEQCINHMRSVHKLKQENVLTTNANGITTAKNYTWDNTANKIMEYAHVQEIFEPV